MSKYKYTYVGKYENAIERLRNKLGSAFGLISLLNFPQGKDLMTEDAIRIANEDLKAVRDLLDDAETDYLELLEYRKQNDKNKHSTNN